MNYYEHHLGDHVKACMRLTMQEEGALLRLKHWILSEERPLPNDERALFRIARAQSRSEREAVRFVLREYFQLREDGFHEPGCDAEIGRYRDKQAKARNSANARWNSLNHQRSRDANAHADASPDAMRTHPPSICSSDALQSPIPRPQSPVGEGSARELEHVARKVKTSPKAGATKTVPADFVVPLDAKTELAAELPNDFDLDRETAKFRDWEFRAPHSDWVRTWRRWMREARDRGNYARKQAGPTVVERPDTPPVLPDGTPNPIVNVNGRYVRQFTVGPEGQIGTNLDTVRWQ